MRLKLLIVFFFSNSALTVKTILILILHPRHHLACCFSSNILCCCFDTVECHGKWTVQLKYLQAEKPVYTVPKTCVHTVPKTCVHCPKNKLKLHLKHQPFTVAAGANCFGLLGHFAHLQLATLHLAIYNSLI